MIADLLKRSPAGSVLRPLVRRSRLVRGAAQVALAPGRETFEGKDLRTRFADNLRWALTHGEVNDYYYLYGLHTLGSEDPGSFLSVRRMMGMIGEQVAEDKARPIVGVLEDKRLFSLLAESLGHRSPRVLAFLNPWDVVWLSPRQDYTYDAFAASAPDTDGFVKPVGGRQARGAFGLRIDRGRFIIEGSALSTSTLKARIKERSILQERVVQHDALSALHAPSINTLRLVTVLRDGVATPLVAALRVGVGGKPVDNWSAGGVVVGIDLSRGRLQGKGLFRPEPQSWLRPGVGRHPDSGILLDGYEVPFIEESVALACRFHQDLGSLRSVGWDVATTPEGPSIIEGNTYWNGAMFMAIDPGFKERYLYSV